MILLVWWELRRFMRDKTKILVAESQPGVAMMMTYLLTWAGCEVQTAWNAERGMKLAQSREFDLIILDMDMPGGFEICSSLRENPFSQTPIVFVSTRFCEDDVQRGRDLGVADFIEKPFVASDFVPRILSLVGESAMA
ncbi:MAG: response regulator [Verrucomicrobiota bacterium]|jgi:DNA-binding response OmpR family regulator